MSNELPTWRCPRCTQVTDDDCSGTVDFDKPGLCWDCAVKLRPGLGAPLLDLPSTEQDVGRPLAGSEWASRLRPLTDLGNAERLADRHAATLGYVPELRAWHHWNGLVWECDADGAAERAAKDTVRAIYGEASGASSEADRKAIADHAKRSESAIRMRAMLDLASSDLRLVTRVAKLNPDPLLLTCANGTVDLCTGKLRAAAASDLITIGIPIAFRPDAAAPVWEKFLEDVFDRDQELIAFMQRFAGYCLTGDTSEQCFAILYGDGANGKSTLVEALKQVTGGFAREAAFQTFAAIKTTSREPREDLARLRGARLVVASEPGGRRWLDPETVKKVTGGDKLVCRELYGQLFEYKPEFKLMVLTNHRPRIPADDEAMWRRVRLIRFAQSFKGREDRQLATKLKAEAEGILAWAIAGAVDWYRHGLGAASAITTATTAYRESEDQIGRFLGNCCQLTPSATVATAELRAAYQQWCADEGETPLSPARLGENLIRRGITISRPNRNGKRVQTYVGVKLT